MDNKDFHVSCDTCKELNKDEQKQYCFRLPKKFEQYYPKDYLKGSQNPMVLIISINPAGPVGTVHNYSKELLEKFNPKNEYKRFYNWYKVMSPKLFANWSNSSTHKQVVAETDLYKCFSPNVNKKLRPSLAENCFPHLYNQLKQLAGNLKVIICNGRNVGNKFIEKFRDSLSNEIIHNSEHKIFSYNFNNTEININTKIIFVPFIQGHLTKNQRSEIGKVIEQVIEAEGINL